MHESNHSPPSPRARFLLLVSATYVESSADGYHYCAILRSLTDATKALIPWFNPAEPFREGTRTSSSLLWLNVLFWAGSFESLP